MADADLQVTFGADASGVQKGAADAVAAIKTIKPAIAEVLESVKSLRAMFNEAFQAPKTDHVAEASTRLSAILEAQRAEIAEQTEALKLKAAVGEISESQMYAQIAAMRQQSVQDELAASMASYNAKMDALKKEMAARQADFDDQQAIAAKMVALASETALRTTKITADSLRQQDADRLASIERFKHEWDGAVDPMVSSFATGLMRMAEGTKSLSQVVRGLGQQMLTDMLRVIDQMVDRWLWSEVAKSMATQTGVAARATAEQTGASRSMAISGAASLKDITNSAATAAGDAYKAMAGIPLIGPVLGAAAAATVFGAVMAFRGLISSAAGGYDIPSGVNPVTQLHAQEMVLPARLANPMRAMLDNYSAAKQAGPIAANDGAGDVHAHFHIHGAMDGPSFKTFLRTNADHLSTVLQEMGRKGMKTA
jgi:hypothetical protein